MAGEGRLSEVERLRKESAAYALLAGRLEARLDTALEIVRLVANAGTNGSVMMCMCMTRGWLPSASPVTWPINQPVYHAPDCVFARSNALLDQIVLWDDDSEEA